MRAYLQIVVLAVLVFAVQGICADPNTPKKAADANSVEPNTPALDSIAVTVNGKNIMESQVEKKIAPRLKSMSAQVPPQYMDQFKQQLRTRAVDGLIIESLLDEQVKAKGVAVSDEEVNNEIAKQLKEQNVTEEDLKKILTNYGISFEQYKKQIKQGLERLQIWVSRDSFMLAQMKMTFPGGDNDVFRLEDVQLNVPIAPGTFDVDVPAPQPRKR
jgi:uncharacterized protein YnzC (UPF0291/DUF896 family)